MSLDAHNLIVPQAGLSSEGVLPGGSQPSGPSDASVADMKTRFDRILASQSGAAQSGIVTPAMPDAAANVPVEAVTDIAPTVFPQAFVTSLADEGLPEAPPEVAVDFVSVVTGPVEMVPTEAGLLTVANEVSPVAPQLEAGAEVAPAADVSPLTAAQTPITAQVPSFELTDAASKTEMPKAEPKVPDLDLAAALMAAQLAASEESGEAPEAQAFETDGDLDALLATLPPELAALLQATANGKPAVAKPAPVTDTNSAAKTATAKPDDLLALSPDKGAEKTVADPALSAVKDITASAEDAATAALPAATAASTHATPAQTQTQTQTQTSQSDAQALMNTLSNRLNGATTASSAATAAAAQAYVMSNQTADNIAALAANIHKRMDGKTLRFDMELRPSDMGRVDVRMEINADGKLSAHLSFDSPLAETEFRGRQDDLRRQLEQSGFNLEDSALSFSSRDQNPQQSGRDANRDGQNDERAPPAVTATTASTQFSHTEDMADDLSPHNWLPGIDGFDRMVGGRLSLNVRV